MFSFKKLCLVLSILGVLSNINAKNIKTNQIKPLTEDWAPFQIKEDGIVSGISIEIVKEIQKRIGNTQKIRFFPWNRGYNVTLRKEGYCLFSTARTKQREKLFKWVGPIAPLKLVMFKLKSNKHIYKTVNDEKKAKSIAVTKNDASQQVLDSMGFKNLQIKTGGSNQINLKKLLKGKAELWPSGLFTGYYRIKQLGVQDKVTVTKAPPFLVLALYIAFNKNTPDSVIKKWQKALDSIKKDGTYDKILSHYR